MKRMTLSLRLTAAGPTADALPTETKLTLRPRLSRAMTMTRR